MVFSAPEMTTVSNPKRNPASADVSDQKKMRPFIVDTGPQISDVRPLDQTWVEAPGLKLEAQLFSRSCLQRISLFAPVADTAVHRNHVGIAHLLQVIGSQSRAEATAAIKDHLGIEFRHASF